MFRLSTRKQNRPSWGQQSPQLPSSWVLGRPALCTGFYSGLLVSESAGYPSSACMLITSAFSWAQSDSRCQGLEEGLGVPDVPTPPHTYPSRLEAGGGEVEP